MKRRGLREEIVAFRDSPQLFRSVSVNVGFTMFNECILRIIVVGVLHALPRRFSVSCNRLLTASCNALSICRA